MNKISNTITSETTKLVEETKPAPKRRRKKNDEPLDDKAFAEKVSRAFKKLV